MSRTTVIAAVKAQAAGGEAVDVSRPGRPEITGRTLTAERWLREWLR